MKALKDSGVEWIGNIPAEWEMKRLKAIFLERKEKNDPQQTDFILSLGAAYGVVPYSEKEGGGNKAKEDLTAYRLAYPDDIVMNSMNIISGSVGISKHFGCVSPVYYMLYPRLEGVNQHYYCRMFQTKAFQRSLLGLGNGILMKETESGNFNTVRMRIPMEKLGVQLLPFPSAEEQKRIADFLDRKCAEIDTVIEKTKATIEEYKKLKQSVITEAVTKGVRGDRPMKDSGVEWIGNIVDGFSIIKLKHLLKEPLMYGANETGITFDENLPRYIRITDITMDGKLKDTGKLSLTEDAAENYILQNNDVLFARSGASVGKAFIYKETYGRSAFAGYLIKASIGEKLLADYLFFYTQSSLYEEWKKQIFVQATIQNIGADRYNILPVVLGSIEEQQEIVNYLEIKCAEIDKLIADKTHLLDEMESYKKSVIYEYVTGKKEVE